MARQSVYCSILVGFSFMVLTLLTVKTLAPEIKTEAASQTASQTVGPYTMSMANDSVASINITPTASQAVYTATNNISVTNTCTAGAAITMTTNSTTSNSLVRTGSDSLTKEIAATTTSSLDNNSWGYALSNSSTYYAVPKKGATAATIYNATAAQTTNLTVPVKFGVKTDSSMPSGAYTNDVVYTMTPKAGCLTYSVTWNMNGGTAKSGATYPTTLNWGQTVNLSQLTPTRDGYTFTGWSVGSSTYTSDNTTANLNPSNAMAVTVTAQWRQNLVGIHSISNMQDMTTAICNATTTPEKTATALDWDGTKHGNTSYVPRKSLKDTRDNKYYLVSKLADGNCWMSQSLALDLTSGTAIVASTTAGGTTTVTPNNTTQTTTGTQWVQADNNWRSYKPQSSEAYYQSGIKKSSSPTGSGDTYLWESAGNYYNWYAATAGTGTSSMTSSDATASICPKGWRLPSNSGTKSYYNLITTTYGLASSSAGSLALRANPLNFNLSGYYEYYFGDMFNRGLGGRYWSSTAYSSATNAYYLTFDMSTINPQSNYYKGLGCSVRCVAF